MLVQSAEDVMELLAGFDGGPRSTFRETQSLTFAPSESEAPADIAGLLGTAPVPVDEIVRQSGASTGAVQTALLELELAGRLIRHAGGRVSLG